MQLIKTNSPEYLAQEFDRAMITSECSVAQERKENHIMRILSIASKTSLAAVLLAFVVFGSTYLEAQAADSEQINKLFGQVREHAVLAEADAEELESYTRSPMSWESHARRIEAMRDHVKDLADDFNQASALRSEGSPWQQKALDELQPLLQGMADHLRVSIDHLAQNQNRIRMKAWIDYVHANRDYAVKASALIRDYVAYGEAKATADELESKLDLNPAPTTD